MENTNIKHPYTILDNLEREAQRADKELKHADAYCKRLTDILNENNMQEEFVSIEMKPEKVGTNGFLRKAAISWDGEFDHEKSDRLSKVIVTTHLMHEDGTGKKKNWESQYFEDMFDEDKIKFTPYLYAIAAKLLKIISDKKKDEDK